MADTMAPDGFLLLGDTETTAPLISQFIALPACDSLYARARTPVARYA